ncbi:MAG: TonB-dependent receptor [Solirubrobacterales bacterium]
MLFVLLCLAVSPARAEEVEVVTRAEIEAEKPASLVELLTRRVGVAESGGALAIRGVPKIAVHLDGVAVDSTVVALNRIRVEDIERVEIHRGAASARFGADALGGAIAITSRKRGGSSSLSLGERHDSLGGYRTGAEAGATVAGLQVGLSAENGRAYRTFNIDAANLPFPHLYPVERSYTDRHGAKVSATHAGDSLSATLALDAAQDSYHWGRPNFYRDDTTLNPKLAFSVDRGGIEWSGGAEFRDLTIDMLRDKGGRSGSGLDPNLLLSEHDRSGSFRLQAKASPVTLGVAYSRDEEASDQRDYSSRALLFRMEDTIEKVSALGSLGGEVLPGWTADLAGRWDRYRYLDTLILDPARGADRPETVTLAAFSPKLSLAWKPMDGLGFSAAMGQGFIPPSPTSLYYRETNPTYVILANPGLQPERSVTWDLGAQLERKGGRAGVSLFHTSWQDKLESTVTPGTPAVSQMRNIGESVSKGAEFSAAGDLGEGWSAEGNYTFTRTRITESADLATVGNRLPDMPTHRLNLGVARNWGDGWSARAKARYQSSEYTDSRNIAVDESGYRWRKAPYWVLDTLLSWRMDVLENPVEVLAAVDNVFDRRFEKRFFERDPGRVFRLEGTIRF